MTFIICTKSGGNDIIGLKYIQCIYNELKIDTKGYKGKGKCALSTLCIISCFPPTCIDISNFVLTCQKIIAETIFLLIFCLCLRIYVGLLTCLEDVTLQKQNYVHETEKQVLRNVISN